MPSSSAAKPRKSAAAEPRQRRAKKKSSRGGWQSLWPLGVCLLLTPVAVHAASILALEGPRPFALLFPWVEVVRSPALHLSADIMGKLSQWMLYLQFPLYGLLMTLTFRADKHLRAFIIALVAHFGGLVTAVMLAYFMQ